MTKAGRFVKKRGPVPIREVMGELSDRLEKKIAEGKRVTTLWQQVAGKKLSLHAEIVPSEDGTWTVWAENASSFYELSLRKGEILRKLQKAVGEGKVRDIRLQSGSFKEK